MKMYRVAALLLMLALNAGANAETDFINLNLPAPYASPARPLAGTIRIWGHGAYGGTEDFIESLVYHYPPTGIDVLTGSFDVRNRGYAIVLFVQQDNPLRRLTLAQVDAVFSAAHRRSAASARTWGDLGLGGVWQHQPIHPYGLSIARGFAEYFEDTVFESSRIWSPALREFADQPGSKGGATDGGQQLLDALADDPQGIGYAGLLYHNPRVRPLAIAVDEAGPYIEPTRENVLNHTYPLTRRITFFLNRAPGQAVDPKLEEFLRYVLSREGQQAVLNEGRGYLPMLAALAASELRKLEDPK
jgi:phosphate transport system substrate-binding protein